MRRYITILVVSGCYQPNQPAGSPCDPSAPVCPSGQHCIAGTCEVSEGPIDAPRDAPIQPPDGSTRFTYVANIAVCLTPLVPDPTTCVTLTGNPNQVMVTHLDQTTSMPWNTYLRFDLDASVIGKPIAGLTLELTAGSGAFAASDDSGVVWQTKSFTLSSIMTSGMVPAKMGTSAVAGSQGAVAKLQVVDWPLPTSLVAAALCLELESPSSDAVGYWNTSGTNPPRLLVDVN